MFNNLYNANTKFCVGNESIEARSQVSWDLLGIFEKDEANNKFYYFDHLKKEIHYLTSAELTTLEMRLWLN